MNPDNKSLTTPVACSPVGRRALLVGGGVWLLAVATASGLIGRYELTPGRVGETPSQLPERMEAAGLRGPLTNGRPLLLMLVHPHCPCTRASLAELERLLANTPTPPRTVVAFVLPKGVDDSWKATALRSQAAEIRNVTTISDVDGTLSRMLGVCTSGHTLFYDATGRLRFSGGITPSRGQEGESPGKSGLQELLTGSTPAAAGLHAPVYGCPLLDPSESLPVSSVRKGISCQVR